MKKIVITGPESSGKTTLFEQLTKAYKVFGVNEYAREYICDLKREYNYQDILEIAKVQFEKEENAFNSNQQFLITDTDLLTLEIWCEFKYGKSHKFITDNLRNHLPDLYLLCCPDMPWEYDPLRENPNDRLELFNIYKTKILSLGVKYLVLKGDMLNRLENSKRLINKTFNS
tara:strand:+ start:4589 stop:5104 length:516 start_codon:yes stop_codon:yes gene_type:complete